MGFFEAVVRALIYICFIALAFFLVVWVLGEIGLAIPPMVFKILIVIFVLFAILILVRLFGPMVSNIEWFPRPKE